MFYVYVTAARVLPGILKIQETLPEIPVDDSGDKRSFWLTG